MITRRDLAIGGLAVAGLAVAGLGLSRWRTGGAEAATETFEVNHTPEEWRKLLTPEQYAVLREEDTERPFTSPLNNEKRKGTFRLRRLRSAAVRLRNQIRQRHRLAEFLRPPRRRGEDQPGLDVRLGQGRGALPPLRRPSRPCVQRRPETHRAALLHERRVAEIRAGLTRVFHASADNSEPNPGLTAFC